MDGDMDDGKWTANSSGESCAAHCLPVPVCLSAQGLFYELLGEGVATGGSPYKYINIQSEIT